MSSAREHLKPNGVFAMYNYYRESWLIDRLARTWRSSTAILPARTASATSGTWRS